MSLLARGDVVLGWLPPLPSGSVNVARMENWCLRNNRQQEKKHLIQQLFVAKYGSTSHLIDMDIMAPLEKVITVYKCHSPSNSPLFINGVADGNDLRVCY